MEIFISVSTDSSLEAVKSALGKNWKTVAGWIKQEKVKADSSAFYTDDDNLDANQALLDTAMGILAKKYPKILKSPEPYRATLDKLVELS